MAKELRTLLARRGLRALADTVEGLRVVKRCRCGSDLCGSFYTAPPPDGSWGPDHRNFMLSPSLILDVVGKEIVYIEVLDRNDVRDALARAMPDPAPGKSQP
ncbi:MAG: hypothetical protein HY294_08200 [Candidatus Rokubacteria bacterium]|nr:hypothetical protein [Candidatus Rokubacteria bacterium]